MEHDAQPHQGDQHSLGEKERGDHGKTSSYRWRNEGIVPGFSGCRISRRLQVHDPMHAAFGNPRLVGNMSNALLAIGTKTLENPQAFVPKSHVGLSSEG
jgi:hypothetical protein